jgi:hypothetical protein
VADSAAPSLQFDWEYYTARSGALGRQWIREFHQPRHAELAEQINEALRLLHRRQPEPAQQHLEMADRTLRSLTDVRPSIGHVLGRMYHGVLSYYFYCVGNFDAAHDELDTAARCVREAASRDQILLPLTQDCPEFCLHHARIARNQKHWSEMNRYIEIVSGMIENRIPLCELDDGTAVDYDRLERHYHSLSFDPEARERLAPILDREQRRYHFDRFTMQIYLLPGFIIPYF